MNIPNYSIKEWEEKLKLQAAELEAFKAGKRFVIDQILAFHDHITMGEIKHKLIPYMVFWKCPCGEELGTDHQILTQRAHEFTAHCKKCGKIHILDKKYPYLFHDYLDD